MERICAKWWEAVCSTLTLIKSAERMTAPRAREQSDPPAPPDRRPPRRGGGSSPYTYAASAAGRAAGPARPAGARRGLVRSARALGAAALLALSGALALPATAQADVLVSNFGQSGSVAANLDDAYYHGQAFSVGADGSNYTLTSIEIPFRNAGIAAADIGSLSVSVWSTDSSGFPSVLLHALMNPASITAGTTVTFNAQAGATLEAGTTYAVVLYFDKVLSPAPGWLLGGSGEDADPATGWEIADSRIARIASGTTWSNSSSSSVYQIRVNGTAAGGTPSNNAPVFSATSTPRTVAENSAAGTNVGAVIPAATDADSGDTLTYSMEGTDAASFDFDASTRQITTITGVTYNHEAAQNSYSVTVKASDGTASATIAVTINVTDVSEQPAKPDPPTVTPEAGVAGSLVVSWVEPGLNGGPDITRYDLEIREGMGGTWGYGGFVVGTTTTILNGLDPDTGYQFRVKARNGETDSDWSEPSDLVKTNAEMGTSGCTLNTGDLWCGVLTVGAITAVQDGFLETTGGLSDTTFSVGTHNYTIDAVSVNDTNASNPGNLLFSLTGGLTTVHKAKLVLHVGSDTFAFGAAQYFPGNHSYVWTGTSLDWSSTSTVTLRLQAPNNAPVFADASVVLEVEENSAVGTDVGTVVTATDADSGDTLEYSLEGTDAASFDIDDSSGQIQTVSGVDYNHEAAQNTYSVTVKATDGLASDTIAVTINVTDANEKPDTPAKPTLAAVSGSSTSLTATWTEPGLNDGPAITGYDLQYREGTAGTWEDFTHGDASTEATITGLTASTEYQVQVRAKNGETDSDWSDPSDAVSTNAGAAAPTITDVEVTSTPVLETDTYGAGETIEVTVTFSEAVNATSDTDFVLSVAGAKRAPLVRGSGTATLVFGYTVVSTDDDDDGIWIGDQDRTLVGNRNGDPQNGTITSVATSTAADLDHTELGQQSDHKADGSRSIVSVAVSSTPMLETDTYGAGETIRFTVTFNVAVDAAGTPSFEFALTGASRVAPYETGNGTTKLVFGYTVVSGDTDTNGIFLWDEQDLDNPDGPVRLGSGDTIRFAGTTTDVPLYWEGRGTRSGHKVDGSQTGVNSAPVFDPATATRLLLENSAAGTNVGAVIPEATDADSGDTLTYSMEGTDAASFDFDASTRQITTIAGVTYNYEATQNTYSVTVKASDGTASATIAVTINLTDAAEKSAKPDKPTLAAVTGSSTTLTATWTKPDLDGGPEIIGYDVQYKVNTASSWEGFAHTGTATTTTITGLTADTSYQVQVRAKNGETDSDWSDPSDAVKTNAAATAPTISAVAVTSTPVLETDTYGAGETIEVSVTFDEAVTATSDTDFELNVSGDRSAPLVRGSGTATLVFGYTVVSSDEDDDGIWIGDQDRTLVGARRLMAQSGTITSLATSTAADLTHSELGQQSDHKVDGSRTPDNNAPVFTSSASLSVEENTDFATVVAVDNDVDDDITGYAITGGTDQAFFSEVTSAGVLRFNDAPNFEDPEDSGTDNTYVVTVQATSGTGTRERTATQTITVTVTDDDTEQSAKPDKPTLAPVPGSSTTLTATWTKPDLNGGPAITGYDVEYREGTAGSWGLVKHITAGVTTTITGLTADTAYQVRVLAVNGETPSDWSDPSDAVKTNAEMGTPTCTLNTGDLWCGVVTVEKHTEGGFDLAYGFVDASVTTNTSDTGALSDETFSVEPNNYTIDTAVTGLQAIAGKLEFGLTSDLTAADKAKLVLHVGSRSFAFSDVAADSTHDYIWSGTGLDWTSESTVTLRLRDTPVTNTAPVFSSTTATREVAENSAAGTNVGAVIPEATDADSGDTLTYSMEGTDAASFDFDASTRQITTITGVTYNHEATQNSYSVTVKAADGNGGTDTIAVTIDVTDVDEKSAKPAKPTLAKVTGSSTSLTATWTKPDLNGGPDITGYAVQYKVNTATTWEDFAHTGTAVTTTITGLTADTSYQMQVRAKNGETDSDWSDPSDAVKTNAEMGTPSCTLNTGDLWCGVLTVGAITATQDGFLETTGGLSDTTFSVGTHNYTIDAVSVNDTNASNPGNLLFSLTGGLTTVHKAKLVLHVGSDTFEFSAAQYFPGNHSYQWTGTSLDWSSTSTVTLRLRAPNNAPVFADASVVLEVEENSAVGTNVGAVIPEATDADSGDTLTYSMEGTDATSFAFDASTRQITTITGVDYNFEATKNTYEVTVKASDGLASDTIAVTIDVTDVNEKSAKPDKPTLAAVMGSSTSLTATWTKPDLNDGPEITGYNLQYREGTTGDWEDFAHTGTATTTTITGLTADTSYQMQVRAKNGETDSDWSDPSDAVKTNAEMSTPTCTLNTGDLWCGAVTVAEIVSGDGFAGTDGDLDDKTFSVGTNNYTINSIYVQTGFNSGTLTFVLMSGLTSADRAVLVLHLGSAEYEFSDATISSSGLSYAWDAGLDWSSESFVELRLREDPAAVDATLSALSVTHAGGSVALRPAFSPSTTEYRASVANPVDEVTVAAEANVAEATLAYLDGDGAAIADADTNTPGREVALEVGATVVEVKVTAEDGTTMRNYRVTVTRRAVNSDHLQTVWLSRFGRTVAGQVVDAVTGRVSGPAGGSQMTLGGQGIDLSAPSAGDDVRRALGGLPGAANDGGPLAGRGAWEAARAGSWEDRQPGLGTERGMTGRELLLGSSFHLAAGGGEAGGPGYAAWGRMSVDGFDGEAPADGGTMRLDGKVTTGILGADAQWERWLAGVALSVSEGKGTFDQPYVDSGTVESSLTSVNPYVRYEASDRLSVWGLVGYGTGDMTIRGNSPVRTDISMRLGAAGARGVLLEGDESGGIDLALRGDAFLVQMDWEKVSSETDTRADASRLRLLLEGGRSFALGPGAVLTPALELGLRHDGGDAETGTGVEVGGRIRYTDVGSGLTVEANARKLVAHEDSDYREWGAGGSVRLDPGASGRGLSLRLAPVWGTPSSGVDRLWSARDAAGLVRDGEFEAERRLEGEVGYGFGAFGERGVMTPWAGLGLAEAGDRTWRAGARWSLAPHLAISLDGARSEPANDDAPVHGAQFRLILRW